jgi:hypothetical protein
MNAYSQLQKLMTSKILNEGVKRAVRERLQMILDNELKQFRWWEESLRHKMNRTRQEQVERRFNKDIQALKIVIHKLTPFMDRVDDEPSIIVKKKKPD